MTGLEVFELCVIALISLGVGFVCSVVLESFGLAGHPDVRGAGTSWGPTFDIDTKRERPERRSRGKVA